MRNFVLKEIIKQRFINIHFDNQKRAFLHTGENAKKNIYRQPKP